jgi:hypothetical protein
MQPSWMEPEWPAPAGVRALSTFRSGGLSAPPYDSLNLGGHVGDSPEAVAQNRRCLAAAARLPSEPVWLTQMHGIDVADLDAEGQAEAVRHADAPGLVDAPGRADVSERSVPGRVHEADAAFTRQPGRVCAVLTADCLPILLAADSGDLVAAAHAGWRGLAGGVIEATVRALGVAPAKLLAWLGPAIGPGHFEVGADVRGALLRGDPGAEAAFAPNARGRFMADLPGLARRRLEALGVSRVSGGGYCTYAEGTRYFSHRRDGQTGRQATLIWLDPASHGSRSSSARFIA